MQEQTLNQNEKHNQRAVVKELVTSAPDKLRTDQIRLAAFKLGISCADTYLRMLARDNEIKRFWELKPKNAKGKQERTNKTKFWSSNEYFDNFISHKIGVNYAL